MQANFPADSQKLRRNPKSGRIAGLCSGLGESLGIDVFWIRLGVVFSVLISFSTTFWIYLILWLVIPKRQETPMPDVPLGLWWTLKRIERQVNRAHRKLPSSLADEIQTAFDLIKVLAPHFDDTRLVTARHEPIRVISLERFPALVRQFMLMPRRAHQAPDRLDERLYQELRLLEQELRTALEASLGWVAPLEADGQTATGTELVEWQTRLTPLLNRLATRVGPETWSQLNDLEAHLSFLLDRTDPAGGFNRDRLEIKKIAYEYLPDALNQYLRLPADRARAQTLAGGKTAEQALCEQLVVLSARLQEHAQAAFEEEARGLMVHGRFIHEKFADPQNAKSGFEP